MNETPVIKTLTFARACIQRLDLVYLDELSYRTVFNSLQVSPGVYKLYEKGEFNRYSDREWSGQELVPRRFDKKWLHLNIDQAVFIGTEGASRRKFE